MTDNQSQPAKPANQPVNRVSGYPLTYWVNKDDSIAVVRINDITIQGWKANGRDLSLDFEHSHFQTIYPSKDRLDEYLAKFEPSSLETYLEYQFAQHQLDDHFREKANHIKDRQRKQVPVTDNPPPTPTKQ